MSDKTKNVTHVHLVHVQPLVMVIMELHLIVNLYKKKLTVQLLLHRLLNHIVEDVEILQIVEKPAAGWMIKLN